MYALIQNNVVLQYPIAVSTWRTKHPNIALPHDPTTAQLNEQGLYAILPSPQPSYDSITQSCTEALPQQVGNQWFQTWIIADNTPEQIVINTEAAKQNTKKIAATLLVDTDWTQVADVPLLNKQEFTDYRAAVRAIALNPTVEATFPTLPVEQWS
jgi:hypothetical protein